MTKPTIADLPDLPARTSAEPNFDENADAFFEGLVDLPAEINTAIDYFADMATEADDSAALAAAYAQQPEGETVEGGDGYSALHYAAKAAANAQATAVDRVQTGLDATTAQTSALAAQSAVGIPDLTNKNGFLLGVLNGGLNLTQGKRLVGSYQEITASANWVKPVGSFLVYVQLIGGGECGRANSQSGALLGGGGGASVDGMFLASQLGETVGVIVGLGSAGGTGSHQQTPGGDTSFGTHLTAFGGGRKAPGSSGTGTPHFSSQDIASFDGAGGGFGAFGDVRHGGDQVRGGGGGGSSFGVGGSSGFDGDGGDGNSNSGGAAGDGQFPGGGGGAASGGSGATSGSGANGVARIWVFSIEDVA